MVSLSVMPGSVAEDAQSGVEVTVRASFAAGSSRAEDLSISVALATGSRTRPGTSADYVPAAAPIEQRSAPDASPEIRRS